MKIRSKILFCINSNQIIIPPKGEIPKLRSCYCYKFDGTNIKVYKHTNDKNPEKIITPQHSIVLIGF